MWLYLGPAGVCEKRDRRNAYRDYIYEVLWGFNYMYSLMNE